LFFLSFSLFFSGGFPAKTWPRLIAEKKAQSTLDRLRDKRSTSLALLRLN
jgi:hypothetical protein